MKAKRAHHSSKYSPEKAKEKARIAKTLWTKNNTEERFYAAKDVADKMTLEQLVDISEDFNVGYDVREGAFEVMLKIPIKNLENTK